MANPTANLGRLCAMPDRLPSLGDLKREVGILPPRRMADFRYDRKRWAHPALALAARIRRSNRWRLARESVLAREPLCRACRAEGVDTPADDIDHILGLAKRPTLAFDQDNLQPLCRSHHTRKEAAVKRAARAPRKLTQPPGVKPTTPEALAQASVRGGLRVLEGSLTKLALNPGDVVVVMSPRALTEGTIQRLEVQLKAVFPGHQVLVLDEGLTLGAATPIPTTPPKA